MALFGSARDISVFRHMNRELLGDIITQQIAFYKLKLNETIFNIYGEASGEKYYNDPTLFNCLITRIDQQYADAPYGVDFNWQIQAAFLKDDLVDGQYVPEVGDIIQYQEGYFEVDGLVSNQLFVGKDPEYPNYDSNGSNPLNPGLQNFGYNTSVVFTTHYAPANRINIIKSNL
jgi:hypothetical protein